MGRTANPVEQPVDVQFNEVALARSEAAVTELALMSQERRQAATALARQLNYEGSTDPGVLENSARDAIRRIGAGIFELGGYLLLLKEACEHGKFLPVLERLGLGVDAAQRYMAVTRRFANTASTRHLAALGVTKLVELLPLDDEQIEDLTELGQTGELHLDDVARMSVKELRATVRAQRADAKASDELMDKKNARIDKLEREKSLIARQSPDEALAALKLEATRITAEAEGVVLGGLRQAIIALQDHADAEGDAHAQDVFLAGLVGQVQAQLNRLREEFGLPDVSEVAHSFEPEAAAAIRAGLAELRVRKAAGAQA